MLSTLGGRSWSHRACTWHSTAFLQADATHAAAMWEGTQYVTQCVCRLVAAWRLYIVTIYDMDKTLTPSYGVLLKRGPHVRKFSAFCGTKALVTVFEKARCLRGRITFVTSWFLTVTACFLFFQLPNWRNTPYRWLSVTDCSGFSYVLTISGGVSGCSLKVLHSLVNTALVADIYQPHYHK
jgi:hypothetical protein